MMATQQDDNIIIETTGGYRNVVTALTLYARFLKYRGTNVAFSTFADFQQGASGEGCVFCRRQGFLSHSTCMRHADD